MRSCDRVSNMALPTNLHCRRHWLCAAVVLTFGACSGRPAPAPSTDVKVLIFAAASTKGPLDAIAKQFTTETRVVVEISPGPSSGLAKQIQQGAAADLFLSADQASMNALGEAHIATRRDLLTNELVVVVPSDSALKVATLDDLKAEQVKKIALAEPKVPAGEYARQALNKADVWSAIEAKVIGGTDVRATLQLVARGEVDAGFVYATDAFASKEVKVALRIPAGDHAPIVYPLALLKKSPAHPGAKQFYDYLAGPAAKQIFTDAQFGIVTP